MSKNISITGSTAPVICDDEDYISLSAYRWSLGGKYVHARVNGRNHKMARVIMGYPNEQVIHKNGDRLDHRKSNLLLVSHQQATFKQPLRSNNKSGYKGVSWDKNRQKWYAYIMIDGRTKSLGRFGDKDEAAIAYNVAALDTFGDDYAAINIINKEPHQ